MSNLSRRRVLQASTALGITGILPFNTRTALAESSPDLEKFVQPLPIPDVREPDGKHNGVDYYEIPLQQFTQKLHPDLPETTLWGFAGQFPWHCHVLEHEDHEMMRPFEVVTDDADESGSGNES